MATYAKFNFKDREELKEKIEELGLDIPFEEDLSLLSKERRIHGKTIPNFLAIHPMEGYDANEDGTPSTLTSNRYRKYGAGGAGLIWWEATAVVEEGKSNPHQLFIHERTVDSLAKLLAEVDEEAYHRYGRKPFHILQLAHSGRYSSPEGTKKPLFLFHHPDLDKKAGIREEEEPVSDAYLEGLIPVYIKAAKLAREAGFDAVDIKFCHRYLLSELLAAFTRRGKFGGEYENRVQLIESIVKGIKREVREDLILAVRMNLYDGIAYPYGFGVHREDEERWDLTEPLKLIHSLSKKGVEIFSITASDPRIKPYMVRPFDGNLGAELPPEHPLEGVHRHFQLTAAVSKEVPDKIVLGAGYSWLREFFPYMAAGNIKRKRASMVGVGRLSFAYPDFASAILNDGKLERKKVCITCSKCTALMRSGGPIGCVIHNQEPYLRLYRERLE